MTDFPRILPPSPLVRRGPAPAKTGVARSVSALRNLRPLARIAPKNKAQVVAPDARHLVTELHQLRKRELYQRAREIDLPGRSAMNKDQLVLALAAHERKRRVNAEAVEASRAKVVNGSPQPAPTIKHPPAWLGAPLRALRLY